MERYTIEEFEELGNIGACIVEGKKSLPPWLKNKGKKHDDDDCDDDDCGKSDKKHGKGKCGKDCKCGKTKLQEAVENMRLLAESGTAPDGDYTDPRYENGTDDLEMFSAVNADGKKVYFVVPFGTVDRDNPSIEDIVSADGCKEYPSIAAATAAIDQNVLSGISDDDLRDFGDVDVGDFRSTADEDEGAEERPFQDGDRGDDYFDSYEAEYSDPRFNQTEDGWDLFSATDGEGENVILVIPADRTDHDDPDIEEIMSAKPKTYPNVKDAIDAIREGLIEDEDDDTIPPDQMYHRHHEPLAPRRPMELRKPLECFGCEKKDSEGQMYLVRWNDGTKDWFCPECYAEYKKEMDDGVYDGENEDGSVARFDGIVKKAIPDLD